MSPLSALNFCVIDTETTGGSPPYDRVIDVAAYRVQDGIILERFSSLVNPERHIPEWITGLTGISNEMVKGAPTFAEIAGPLKALLSKGIFTAHNAGFDFKFIREEFVRLGETPLWPQLCTVKLARRLFPKLPSRSLGALCDHLLIDVVDRHRAAGDAEATVYVLKQLLQLCERRHGVKRWADLEVYLKFGEMSLPEGLTYADLIKLPSVKGELHLTGENGEVLEKVKASNIQKRAFHIFSVKNRKEKWVNVRSKVNALRVNADISSLLYHQAQAEVAK